MIGRPYPDRKPGPFTTDEEIIDAAIRDTLRYESEHRCGDVTSYPRYVIAFKKYFSDKYTVLQNILKLVIANRIMMFEDLNIQKCIY
jgi:hypothetical protein